MLSTELCHEILDYLPSPALKACTLTSASFREIAQPKLFYHMTIDPKEMPWKYKIRWFLYDSRGMVLYKGVRHLGLFVQGFASVSDEDTKEVVKMFQLLSPLLHTLELCDLERQELPLNKTIMDGLRLFVLPPIRTLVVHQEAVPSLDILACCTALKRFEVRVWNPEFSPPARNVESKTCTFPQLERLLLGSLTGQLPPHSTTLGAYLYSQHGMVKYLRFEGWYFFGPFTSFDILLPYKALVNLSFDVQLYEYLGRQEPPCEILIPLHSLPTLLTLEFGISFPQAPHWPRFFRWMGLHLRNLQPSSVLREIELSFFHPAVAHHHFHHISDHCNTHTQCLEEFNEIAANSNTFLAFIIRTRSRDGQYGDEKSERGYKLAVAVVKEWLPSWFQAGKLYIWRKWLI
ncbi:hypothetical protein DL96DRAFT_1812792 [Flagelloscypha sp. PMI_526]|nr:hypothetical protein DL96DRAFT_1812792 [Flagelloscypha sp. PMI_526]